MSKIKKLAASPAVTIGALALAVLLLAFSAIGGTRAALTYYSENYVSTVQMHELGVSLVENGNVVASGDAGTSASTISSGSVTQGSTLLAKGTLILNGAEEPEAVNEPFKLGAVYQEQLAVKNATDEGSQNHITQYVRVTVQRYWLKPAETATVDEEGNSVTGWTKHPDLDPYLIDLNFKTDEGWVIDPEATTPERTVLYYTQKLEPGKTTPLFADTLQIDPSVQVTVKQENKEGVITNTYVYDGCAFQLEVKVDAVQDHNAADAIRSAWGREVTIGADGTLSLADNTQPDTTQPDDTQSDDTQTDLG